MLKCINSVSELCDTLMIQFDLPHVPILRILTETIASVLDRFHFKKIVLTVYLHSCDRRVLHLYGG